MPLARPHERRTVWTDAYGDLFTPRQLVALTTFSDLVQEARERVQRDALAAGLPDDAKPLRDGGTGADGLCRGGGAVLGSRRRASGRRVGLCVMARWRAANERSVPTFGRQAFPMVWDYAERNPFWVSSGSYATGD